jgi:hypothetical protein
MKKLIFFMMLLVSHSVLANLYLTTQYQEAGKEIVTTKHHIFLNKRYVINYSKMAYSLTLIKVDKERGTIETETFTVNNKGHRDFSAGGIANFSLGKPIKLEQFLKSGKREFILKIIPEKIVP